MNSERPGCGRFAEAPTRAKLGTAQGVCPAISEAVHFAMMALHADS